MDMTFLNYLLVLCLALLLVLYLNQMMNNNKNNTNAKNKMQKHMQMKNPHTNSGPIVLNKCAQGITSGMPIHRVGPIKNFHQHFTKYGKYNTVGGCGFPTGIRELGFRNLYLANFTKNEVPKDDPFSGISTRNYLDNMESVDNIYRKCF